MPFDALGHPPPWDGVTVYYVRYRYRGDPPGQWHRSEPFEDRTAAQAHADALAGREPAPEVRVVVAIDDDLACS